MSISHVKLIVDIYTKHELQNNDCNKVATDTTIIATDHETKHTVSIINGGLADDLRNVLLSESIL